jgi:hypothetical protein
MSTVKVNTVDKRTGGTLTLGGCGTTVTLGAGATQSGFGRTGTVDWCTTIKTAPFTAVNGDGFFVNTTSGAITVTLPATPTAGDIISLKDYGSTWQTNNVTLCNNGNKINGVCSTASLITQGQSVTLIYVDATKGWQDINDSTSNISGNTYITATGGTIITCGDYKTHVFTADGCFAVSSIGSSPANNVVDYLVVAGGGAGGGSEQAGGGGAGGFRVSNELGLSAPSMSPLANTTGLIATVANYPITVGAGATTTIAPSSTGVDGSPGSNSIFSTIISTGGGGAGGGDNPSSPTVGTGQPGGSGGGGGSAGSTPGTPAGGSGNTPPVSPPQGNNGGSGMYNPAGNPGIGGGGGGAGAVGNNADPAGSPTGGKGGIGSYISNTFIGSCAPSYGTPGPVGSVRYFGGGGGGGTYSFPVLASGGDGGGGTGARGSPLTLSIAGTANTGGGGGGGGSYGPGCASSGGAGGSGIVMIRYKFQ